MIILNVANEANESFTERGEDVYFVSFGDNVAEAKEKALDYLNKTYDYFEYEMDLFNGKNLNWFLRGKLGDNLRFESNILVLDKNLASEIMEEFEKFLKITEAKNTINKDDIAEFMAEILTNDECSTYGVFEDLVSAYELGSEDARIAIDRTVSVLTGWNLSEIAETLLRKNKEKEQADIERDL